MKVQDESALKGGFQLLVLSVTCLVLTCFMCLAILHSILSYLSYNSPSPVAASCRQALEASQFFKAAQIRRGQAPVALDGMNGMLYDLKILRENSTPNLGSLGARSPPRKLAPEKGGFWEETQTMSGFALFFAHLWRFRKKLSKLSRALENRPFRYS